MDPIFDEILLQERQRGAIATRITARFTNTDDNGVETEVEEIVREVDFLDDLQGHNQRRALAFLQTLGMSNPADPRRPNGAGAAQAPQPATLCDQHPHAVPAIHMMHGGVSTADARQMVPSLLQRCERYQTTPTEVLGTLTALHHIHRSGNRHRDIGDVVRERALSVALEMYGSAVLRTPQEQIRDAREVAWTRIIEFSGDLTLTALATTSITGTAAAATYMTGVYAGAHLAAAKTAASTGAVAKAGLLGGAAVIGSAAIGLVTAGVGAFSVAWWMGTIDAYRDTWDNNFARDAWFFHKMRDHHVLADNGQYQRSCNHSNGDWTTLNNRYVAWKKGWGSN